MNSPPPELRSARLVLRRPTQDDVQTRLSLGRHQEIVEAYGGVFDPTAAFTRFDAQSAIRFIEKQDYAWVIDAGGFIGHVRFHTLVQADKRATLAVGIDDPASLGKGYGTEAGSIAFRCAC